MNCVPFVYLLLLIAKTSAPHIYYILRMQYIICTYNIRISVGERGRDNALCLPSSLHTKSLLQLIEATR